MSKARLLKTLLWINGLILGVPILVITWTGLKNVSLLVRLPVSILAGELALLFGLAMAYLMLENVLR